MRINLVLLVIGCLGAALSAWAMRDRSSSSQMAERLGMSRVASNWDGILSILALPILMFCLILVVWSVVELWRAYRAINDPASYGQARRRDG